MLVIDGLYTDRHGKYIKLLGLATNDVNDERVVIYTHDIEANFPMKFMPEDTFGRKYILFSRTIGAGV